MMPKIHLFATNFPFYFKFHSMRIIKILQNILRIRLERLEKKKVPQLILLPLIVGFK